MSVEMKAENKVFNGSLVTALRTASIVAIAIFVTSVTHANAPAYESNGQWVRPSRARNTQMQDGSQWTPPQTPSRPRKAGERVRTCSQTPGLKIPDGGCHINMYHAINTTGSCNEILNNGEERSIVFFYTEEFDQIDIKSKLSPANISQSRTEHLPYERYMLCGTDPNYYLPMVIPKTVRISCSNGTATALSMVRDAGQSEADGSCARRDFRAKPVPSAVQTSQVQQ